MERVLPNGAVKARVADLAVGLAADCDNSEAAVEQIMRKHLPGATGLPFVAFLTHDGQWVDGFSGSTDRDKFLGALKKAEQAPALQASPKVRQKLAGILKRAQRAVGKEDWKTVVKSGQKARALRGRCPERVELNACVAKARAWAEAQFKTAVRLAAKSGDLDAVEKMLKDIKNDFRGDPEADDAAAGLKAIKELQVIRAKEKDERDEEARAKAAEEFKDSRWKKIFTGKIEEESVIEGLD